MKQEDKQLLLVDLCARLPYGVKCKHKFSDYKEILDGIKYENAFCYFINCEPCLIEDIKPYLLPLSSMTEEQEEEYNNLNCYELGCFPHTEEALDYLIENHFDYRYLIDKGLAIDATGLNIY